MKKDMVEYREKDCSVRRVKLIPLLLMQLNNAMKYKRLLHNAIVLHHKIIIRWLTNNCPLLRLYLEIQMSNHLSKINRWQQ